MGLTNLVINNEGSNSKFEKTNMPLEDHLNKILKRYFDIFLASVFIFLLLPLLLLISIIIKLTSKGQVLFIQDRVTANNKIFKMYKFRTMKTGAENKTGPVLASERDERCTFFGYYLRRLSFDELPQLINVLKGDMSIVGPRPERPFFIDIFKNEITDYLERHCVKAGITGWAQIHGLRGKTSIEKRVLYDLYYIKNWSFNLDLIIIFKTFFIVFRDFLAGKAC